LKALLNLYLFTLFSTTIVIETQHFLKLQITMLVLSSKHTKKRTMHRKSIKYYFKCSQNTSR
jgi:hypothetical protein